jgi:hypothetical protein
MRVSGLDKMRGMHEDMKSAHTQFYWKNMVGRDNCVTCAILGQVLEV